MKNTLKLIIGLFIVLVVVPAAFSWGPGLDINWHGLKIHHHSVRNGWVAFFGILLVLYTVSSRFREGCLAAISRYDAASSGVHRRTEIGLLSVLTLGLGWLKWLQSAGLNTVVRDHGLFVNVMWNSAHGQGPWSSVVGRHFFSEHFSLILIPLALPYKLVQWAAWPLWIQTAAMMAAVAVAIYIGWSILPVRPIERLLLILVFVLNFCFQTIHVADMHPIALGISVPLILYVLAQKNRWGWFYACLPLAFFTIQEDVSLMILGLSFFFLAKRETRKHGVIVFVLALAAFWINVEFGIRHFAGGASGFMNRYETMGGDMKRIVATLVLKPWVPLGLLLQPSHVIPLIKLFSYFAFLPLGAPIYLVGLIPGIMQHSLTDYAPQFEYGYHYTSNVLPFLMLATLACLSARRFPWRAIVPGFLLLMTYMHLRAPAYLSFRDPGVVKGSWALAPQFGPEVKVSVQNSIGLPFCFRRNVYLFPFVGDADVVVLSPMEYKPYIDSQDYPARVAALHDDKNWILDEQQKGFWVFRRKVGIKS